MTFCLCTGRCLAQSLVHNKCSINVSQMHEWILCVIYWMCASPPQFVCRTPNPPCNGISGWGSQEVIRSWGWSLHGRDLWVSLRKEEKISLRGHPPRKATKAPKRALTENLTMPAPLTPISDFQLPEPQEINAYLNHPGCGAGCSTPSWLMETVWQHLSREWSLPSRSLQSIWEENRDIIT